MIFESIKIVLKELRKNKMRTFLTMLGIIVGIFSITIIFALSNATKDYMTNTVSSFATELTQFSVATENYIEAEIIEKRLTEYVNESSKVKKMSKATIISFPEYDNIVENIGSEYGYYSYGQYFGIDENYFELNLSNVTEEQLLSGRILDKKDIINKMPYVVLREDVANNIFGTVDVVGKKLIINGYEFEIIGILKYDENAIDSLDMSCIYISYYFATEYLDGGYGTIYYFSAEKNEYSKDIKEEVQEILNEYISSEKYEYYSMELDMMMGEIDSIVSIVEIVFIGIASLSIIVGGIGIMNIMLVSVSERIKETGIRMALGAKNSDIVFQFLIEGIMLTILSGIIGILLAGMIILGVNFVIQEYTTYDFSLIIDLITMIKIIVFCGIIGTVFGIYPAIKAGKLDPVEALKYE